MDALRLKGWCERCLIDVWHHDIMARLVLPCRGDTMIFIYWLVWHTSWFRLIATLETSFWSLACLVFCCREVVKLLWRRQAGQGSLGTRCKQGMMAPPEFRSTYHHSKALISPPSSFDAPFGRVGYVLFCGREKKDAIVLFCMLYLFSMQGTAPSPPGVVFFFAAAVLCGLAWRSNSKPANVPAFAFWSASKVQRVSLGNECYYVLTVDRSLLCILRMQESCSNNSMYGIHSQTKEPLVGYTHKPPS